MRKLCREVNKKKIHRLWREEGLQVKVTSPHKRAGISSMPPIEVDAPNVVWATDFQFDSTIDGKAFKIASMIDEHTRESLLNLVERSITGEALVEELTTVFAANGGPPKVLRMDNGYIESISTRLRNECLNRNYWNTVFEARVVIGDFKTGNSRHRHSALG